MKKPTAEFIGTFALVFFGCGAAVIAGMGTGPTAIDVLGIAFAFGFAIVAMAYGIGPISGCHVNPAVSFGVLIAGRMTMRDFISYVIAQVLGALAGAAVLYLILSGKSAGWTGGLGQNGWGTAYLGQYNLLSAFIFEVTRNLPAAGWRRSEERTRLQPNSLLSGNLTGNFARKQPIEAMRGDHLRHFQRLMIEFPT
jgi:aquaporin Z